MDSKINMRRVMKFRPWSNVREIPLTVMALLFFLVSLYLVSLANAYTDRINIFLYLPLDERFRLPDPILETLNPIYKRFNLPDDLPDSLVHLAPLFILIRAALGGRRTLQILGRAGYMIGVGYLIRIVFILMTILPDPDIHCEVDDSSSIFFDAWLFMLQIKRSCGDVVFSGHTIAFMSASLVWIENPVEWLNFKLQRFINFMVCLYSFLGVISLVASTFHYTLDCILSVCFMTFIWKFYHFIVNTDYFNLTCLGNFINFIDGSKYHYILELPIYTKLPLTEKLNPSTTREMESLTDIV